MFAEQVLNHTKTLLLSNMQQPNSIQITLEHHDGNHDINTTIKTNGFVTFH